MIAYCLGLLRLFLSPFLFLMVSLVFQFRKLLTESMFQPLKKDRSDSDLTAATQEIQLDSDEIATDLDNLTPTLTALNIDTGMDDTHIHDNENKKGSRNKSSVMDDPDVESGANLDLDTPFKHDKFVEPSQTCESKKCREDESSSKIETNYNSTDNTINDTMTYDLDVENGEVNLPNEKTFPNSCAICLCPYQPNERIVWSTNSNCHHAFHSECIVEWLVKMQDGSPCPCCRQEFVELGPRPKKKGERTRSSSIRSLVSSVQASMRYSSLR